MVKECRLIAMLLHVFASALRERWNGKSKHRLLQYSEIFTVSDKINFNMEFWGGKQNIAYYIRHTYYPKLKSYILNR
jgi:hypothetical protein